MKVEPGLRELYDLPQDVNITIAEFTMPNGKLYNARTWENIPPGWVTCRLYVSQWLRPIGQDGKHMNVPKPESTNDFEFGSIAVAGEQTVMPTPDPTARITTYSEDD